MPERYKILLVEDDEIDVMAFERFVREQGLLYDYTIAASVSEAKELLLSKQFDVALMDYSLRDGTSLDIFQAAAHIPIIITTWSNSLQIAIDLMKAGAYDFIVKDPQGNYLIALPITVKNTIERWNAQQELTHYRNHLEKVIEERTTSWMEGELRLRTIVEATPVIVFSLDLESNFTFLSGHTKQILGYLPHELLGKPLLSLFPDKPVLATGFQNLATGRVFMVDIEFNGHWLSISVFAKQEGDALTGFIGVIQDISERKYAELTVIQERNLLRTLLDNIPDYIFIKDRDGRFIETNNAHAAGSNLSREAMINHTAMELFDPTLAEQFHADDMYVMTNGKSITNEERTTTGEDGSKRWVLTTKVPLYDENKKNIIGLVGISRDITDRRNAEATRRQAEQNRIEIERNRIEIEREHEIIDLKQRFITTVSHDFRTPLSIIKMSASTLQTYYDRFSPDKRVEKFTQIHSQIDHMVNLLDDVLTLSKAQGGKLDISLKSFDLRYFCERVWEDMIEVNQQKHQCRFEFLANTPQIVADEHLLQQILVNLLSNAFKYTPVEGNIQFKIASDDQYIIFYISDSGYGIPENDQKHLFEPFYRGANVKTIQGTGLGLMIVKTYVEIHQGNIVVETKEGVGTTFTVKIPRK